MERNAFGPTAQASKGLLKTTPRQLVTESQWREVKDDNGDGDGDEVKDINMKSFPRWLQRTKSLNDHHFYAFTQVYYRPDNGNDTTTTPSFSRYAVRLHDLR